MWCKTPHCKVGFWAEQWFTGIVGPVISKQGWFSLVGLASLGPFGHFLMYEECLSQVFRGAKRRDFHSAPQAKIFGFSHSKFVKIGQVCNHWCIKFTKLAKYSWKFAIFANFCRKQGWQGWFYFHHPRKQRWQGWQGWVVGPTMTLTKAGLCVFRFCVSHKTFQKKKKNMSRAIPWPQND